MEALDAERITALWAGSPQFVTGLCAELDACPELDVSALQVLVYGWGALAPPVLEDLQKHCRELVTIGIFGQTEAIACHRFWPTKWPDLHRGTAPAVNYVGVPSRCSPPTWWTRPASRCAANPARSSTAPRS